MKVLLNLLGHLEVTLPIIQTLTITHGTGRLSKDLVAINAKTTLKGHVVEIGNKGGQPMTYVMSHQQYWSFRNDLHMKHKEIIEYLNQSLNFRGEIKSIRVLGRN